MRACYVRVIVDVWTWARSRSWDARTFGIFMGGLFRREWRSPIVRWRDMCITWLVFRGITFHFISTLKITMVPLCLCGKLILILYIHFMMDLYNILKQNKKVCSIYSRATLPHQPEAKVWWPHISIYNWHPTCIICYFSLPLKHHQFIMITVYQNKNNPKHISLIVVL